MAKQILALDSHALSAFQACEQKDYYADILNLRVRAQKAGITKGTIWHSISILHFLARKRGTPGSRHKYSIDAIRFYKIINWYTKRHGADLNEETQQLVVLRYLQFIKDTSNYLYNLIGYEVGFSKVLYEDDSVIFIYEGSIDWVVKDNNDNLFWLDKKTQHPKFTKDLYPHVNQFLGYSWALGSLRGIIEYTTFSQKVNERTFRSPIICFSEQQIRQWQIDTINWFYRIFYVRKGIIRRLRNRSACDGKYGVCQFAQICEHTNLEDSIIKMNYIQAEHRRAW